MLRQGTKRKTSYHAFEPSKRQQLFGAQWRQRMLIGAVCLFCIVLWKAPSLREWSYPEPQYESYQSPAEMPALPCRDLPGANETVVVLKTGSTELKEKLTVHLSTTLRCYPNFLIFSDYAEQYGGVEILDALESVPSYLKDRHADFGLHRRLRQVGRTGLTHADFHGLPTDPTSMIGNAGNPGWKLDKWKFLPMVNRTFYEYPDMKWYVFAEVDTYMLWSVLLQYLEDLDHTRPYYVGNQMQISNVFAHGGSGFAVSQPAMRMVIDYWTSHQREFDYVTDLNWAGDEVLGKAFINSDIQLTYGWPIFQLDYPGVVPYARPDDRSVYDSRMRLWCYPTVSYHHVSPETVEDLWNFEQDWIARSNESHIKFLRHRDMFKQYILPRMQDAREDWDNESSHGEHRVDDFEACREFCLSDPDCKQYAFHEKIGICRTHNDPRLGQRSVDDVKSDWLVDRIKRVSDRMAPCVLEGWIH